MMLRFTIILLALGLCRIGLSKDLIGQVFILSEDYDEVKCEAVADCDCCATDLFFLTTSKFGLINRCLSGDSYFTGTYSLKTNKLKLNFNRKYVNEVVDEDYNVTGHKTQQTKIDPVEFDIKRCGQKNRLTNLKTTEWKNGSRYTKSEEKAMLNDLLTSKGWKQLSE